MGPAPDRTVRSHSGSSAKKVPGEWISSFLFALKLSGLSCTLPDSSLHYSKLLFTPFFASLCFSSLVFSCLLLSSLVFSTLLYSFPFYSTLLCFSLISTFLSTLLALMFFLLRSHHFFFHPSSLLWTSPCLFSWRSFSWQFFLLLCISLSLFRSVSISQHLFLLTSHSLDKSLSSNLKRS